MIIMIIVMFDNSSSSSSSSSSSCSMVVIGWGHMRLNSGPTQRGNDYSLGGGYVYTCLSYANMYIT